MLKTDKFHLGRLKGIAQTISTAESDRKALAAMVAKMEKSTAKLKVNIANLDVKINRYKTLQTNVERDPNYNAKNDPNFNF